MHQFHCELKNFREKEKELEVNMSVIETESHDCGEISIIKCSISYTISKWYLFTKSTVSWFYHINLLAHLLSEFIRSSAHVLISMKMCSSGQDTEDKGCLFSSTRRFSGILDWQQIFWKIHILWRRWLPAACSGLLTKRKRADICSKLQPCCCPGFRRQGSFPGNYHEVTAPPEHEPSDLCRNNVFLAVTAGNDVLGAVFWEQCLSLAVILFYYFLRLCVHVDFCSYYIHTYILHSHSSPNVSVTMLCSIFAACIYQNQL